VSRKVAQEKGELRSPPPPATRPVTCLQVVVPGSRKGRGIFRSYKMRLDLSLQADMAKLAARSVAS
jgi:hypothetical protein